MKRRILVWFWSGGGGSHFALHLTHRLSGIFGAHAVALSLRAGDPNIERARALGLVVKTADIVSDRRRPVASLLGLARAVQVLKQHAEDADAIVAAMNFAMLAPLALVAGKPIVYCAHDPSPHPGDYARTGQRMTQAFIMSRAARVVALSDHARRTLARDASLRGKLVVAPLGSVFEPAAAPPTPSHTPVRLLFAGRMMRYKGLDVLADALQLIAHRNDWRLTVAGAGPALTAAMARRLQHPQVRCIRNEWLEEGELDALMREHDVLLAPYIEASQSGVVARAVSCGMPCVVNPVGALAEQIGGGCAGWLAAAPRAQEFAAAMTAMLDDAAARGRKAAAARRLAQQVWEADHWSWLGGDLSGPLQP